jgi:RHS repeat-associated protein
VLDEGVDGFGRWSTSFDQVSGEEWTIPGSRNGSWQIKSTEADGSYTISQYRLGRLESATSYGFGGQRISHASHGYDEHGRVSSISDLRTGTTTITYYNDDQVKTVTAPDPEGNGQLTTAHQYNAAGLLEKRSLPDGTQTSYTYTSLGQLDTVTGSQTYPLDYDYDAQGRLVRMTAKQDAGSTITSWRYDSALGNLEAKRDHAGKEVSYSYTPGGRLKTRTWARGVSTAYTYHNDGALATVDYSDATADLAYTYHRHGAVKEVRASSATGGTGNPAHVHTYGFDDKLRPATETISTKGQHLLTRHYEPGGAGRYRGFNLTGALLPAADSQSYSYDSAGNIGSVESRGGTFAYGYVTESSLVETVTGPTHVVRNTYQPQGYGLKARENKVGDSLVSGFAYRSNKLGQRTDQVRTGVAFAQPSALAYRYNSKGQLTAAERFEGPNPDSLGAPILPETFHYDFDDIGNRRTVKRGTLAAPLIQETYTTNLLNQYTGIAVAGAGPPQSASRTYTHDDDGNLVGDGRWRYEWDGENRLVRMQELAPLADQPAIRLDFEYDYQGRRVGKTRSIYNTDTALWTKSSEIHFLYDGWNLVAEVDVLTPSSPQLLRTYAWGVDMSGDLQGAGGVGGLLALVEHPAAQDPAPPPVEGAEPPPPPAPRTFFPTYDGSGNISEWLNETGAVVAHQEYGPFGEVVSKTGPAAGRFAFGFSTKYTDAETGLLYYGYRYYSPETGRWLSRDPVEEQGGANLYGFNNNDPANEIDPLGQSPISVVAKWAVKLGVKKAIHEYVEHRIKKEILGAIKGRAYKKAAKELGEEALKVLDTLDAAWWETAIELIPIGGDIYGTGKFAVKLHEINRKIEDIERRAGKLAEEAAEHSKKVLQKARKSAPNAQNPVKRGTGGRGYRVNDTGRHGDLSPNTGRASGHSTSTPDGRVQSHHPVQQKWASENIDGYDPDDAPTILLRTTKGNPHALINGMQRRTGNGAGNTLRQEMSRGYRQMIDAGVDPRAAKKAMKKNYNYFVGRLGASLD